MSGIQERREKETEKESEKMPVNVVHVPMVEPQMVEPKLVDTEVHIQKVELPPVEVTFREPPRITIRLNDKIPDLSALLRDKTE